MCVLYSYSSNEFKEGYNLLKSRYPDVIWVDRTNFKQDLIDAVSGEYTTIFCDDDVMIRPFSEDSNEFRLFNQDKTIISLSLRMDKRYTDYLDMVGVMPPPHFNENNTWSWKGLPWDWGCPIALLGNMYRTEMILPLLKETNYNTPSSLEPQLQIRTPNVPLMICFDRAKTINCPMNKVQTESPAPKCGNISEHMLNREYLEGKYINLDTIIEQTENSTSCFKFVDYNLRSY